jgi:hypothetical protein
MDDNRRVPRRETMKISDHDRRTLNRIRNGEQLVPSVVKNMVRRGIVRKVSVIEPSEIREWGNVIGRRWTWEIITPELR